MTPVNTATVFDWQRDPTGNVYVPGSNLEVPGLEAIIEYGDASKFQGGRIPGSMLINDHSRLDKVRVTQLDGLHDDPEGGDTRQPNADRHGERAGQMLYHGRTLGLTGRVEAGNLGAMRDNWRRFRGQFGTIERDLVIHHPFELPLRINEVLNPNFAVDTATWAAPSTTSGTVALTRATSTLKTMGNLAVTGATGSGSVRAWVDLLDASLNAQVSPWLGQDVWIHALVKVASSTLTISSITLGLAEWSNYRPGVGAPRTLPVAASKVTQASPTTGTLYALTARIPAAVFAPATTYVTPTVELNYSSGGNATLNFYSVGMVFVDAQDPSPLAYFDGDTPGFAWRGAPQLSSSGGPTHSENMIEDPRFEDFDPATMSISSWGAYTAGGTITLNPGVSRSLGWPGNNVSAAGYVTAFKDNNATSRAMGVQALRNSQPYFPVVDGRRYRFSAAVNLLIKPATGNVVLSIAWVTDSAGTISTINSDLLVIGENTPDEAFVEQAAPADAVGAVLSIWNPGTTTANAQLKMYWSDPCFVDVTDLDPGNFYGVGDRAEETGNRRRIPRPFLLRGVRKTSDMKAPEQQTRSRAWRDFTMSLRASDPRIYVLDERSEWLQMSGNPKLVFRNLYEGIVSFTSFGVTTHTAITTPPIGFTAEGQSGTAGWHYGVQSMFDSRPMLTVGDTADAHVAAPAAPAIQRAYRSAEGYTYTHPRVTIHGHFQMRWMAGGSSPASTAYQRDNATDFQSWNGVGILLKRVSASQWLEVRVNASSHAQLLAVFGFPNAPYTVELWSSHNASGAAAVTRLAQWDLLASLATLSDPARYPMIIEAEIDASQNVNFDISGTDNAGAPLHSMSGTYALPSALQPLFGTSVAGHCGEWMRSDNWAAFDDWTDMTTLDVGFPWISYFEASMSNVAPGLMQIPVIGDIETPQRITLRGNIDGPILQLNSTDEDGSPISSTMRLTGVADEDNPVTIDVGDRTIKDAQGANRYSMLDSGSLHQLMPGSNELTLTARNWGSYPNHAQLAWRDALS